MDANQTRFHLVLGQADWFGPELGSPPQALGLEWRASDSTVGLTQNLFVFPVASTSTQLTAADRRGAAQDQYGNYYWVGPNQDEVLFLGAGQQQAQHFWSAKDLVSKASQSTLGAFAPVHAAVAASYQFGGLAVTTDHYLVIGMLSPPGLMLFDLYAGGPPMQYRWPASVAFAPFAIAAGADGGAWILDRVNRQYWGLDPYFRVLAVPAGAAGAPRPDDFQPAGAPATYRSQCEPEEQVAANQAMPLAALAPIGMAALPDGSVLILDNPPGLGYSQVYRYRLQNLLSGPVALNQVDVGQSAPYQLLGQDMAFVASATQPSLNGMQGTLYIADARGAQTFSFNYDSNHPGWAMEPNTQFLPMLRFGGKALITSASGVSYDYDQRWAALVAQPRARFDTQVTWQLPMRDASLDADPLACAFDGKEPGCVWHRLVMDGMIPAGTQVRVQSRAADFRADLSATDWNPEPQPYLRFTGAEVPYYQPALDGCSNKTGTWELLFQSAVGRYLQIQLTLIGNGRSTPRLQAVRAYYPRFSYLKKYLPAVYQNDPTSASFLDRYLANPEGFFTVLEGRIQQVQELFDANTVPAEYLDWLATWLGVSFDFTWTDASRRFYLANALKFFWSRGTSDGLVRMIRMALDQCADDSLFDPADLDHFSVRIVENYLLSSAPGVTFGDPATTPATVDAGANRFTVVVPVQLQDSLATQTARLNLAQRIAQNEKPAHTSFDVKLYWAAFCAGEARVGMETVVGPSSRFAAMVLDQNQLAASYLGFVLPWTVRGRMVAGRDQLRNGARSGEQAL